MRGRTGLPVWSVATALVLALAACGDDSDQAGGGSSPAPTAAASPTAADPRASLVSVTGHSGSLGVVFDADGHILTIDPGVPKGGSVTVAVGGRSGPATVVGSDPRTRLAVVKVDAPSGLVPAVFGDSDQVRAGEAVRLLGRQAMSGGTAPTGKVGDPTKVSSSLSMIETDLASQPGDSCAAVLNSAGQIVGLVALIVSGGADTYARGSLALPANTATRVARQLIEGGQVTHPYLGVSVEDADRDGALVRGVPANSPGGQAGLRSGDVIVRVGDRTVSDAGDVLAAVQAATVGQTVTVGYIRGGGEQETTVTIGQAPAR
jgi:putative serine protease PepD